MPLGARDILLIIRANDEASRVLRNVGVGISRLGDDGRVTGGHMMALGQGMSAIGLGIAGIGAAGAAFFGSATKAAIEYNQKAALTLTQVDQLGVKLEDIKRIGREVAKAIPAPFEQMQESLYDIFSSMNVNTQGAQRLLEYFAKGAVAGQTDVQTAGRASIAIMNAFKIPVEDVNKVMDVQFQAVRKGVFTYKEFASTIGRAIPSTVKAGGTIQDLAGMMAFMTRNGMSAAQAATSAARGFDLLTNPAFGARMAKIGISVTDANGKFKPMVQIVSELRGKLSGLSEEARAHKLKELTQGAGGVIQAMRFMNLGVLDGKNLLGDLTNSMNSASGAMGNAYDIMLKQPQTQMQLLKNNWQILRTEIGDAFLPVINKMVQVGMKVLKWFNDLSPKTKEMIIRIALIGTAVAIVVGVLLTFIGLLVSLVGMVMLVTGASAGLAALLLGGLVVGVLAVIAAIIAVIVYWDKIKEKMESVGLTVENVKGFFRDLSESIVDIASALWKRIVDVWNRIKENTEKVWKEFLELVQNVIEDLQKFWDKHGQEIMESFKDIWEKIVKNTKGTIGPLVEFISHVLNVMLGIIKFVLAAIMVAWDMWGDELLDVVMIVFRLMRDTISGALDVIFGIVKFFLAIFNGEWGKAWDAIKQILSGVWNAFEGIIKAAWGLMKAAVEAGLSLVRGIWDAGWELFKDIPRAVFAFIIDKFLAMAEWLVKAAAGAFGWIPGVGEDLQNAAKAIEGFRDRTNKALRGIDKKVEVEVSAKLNWAEIAKGQYGGQVPQKAKGGAFHGPTLVGEEGPELITGRGFVQNNRRTNQILERATGTTIEQGAVQVIIQGNADEKTIQIMDEKLRMLLLDLTNARRGRG